MKKQNLILSSFLSIGLLALSACGDDEVGKASKEEVKAAFQSANDQISADLNSFQTSSGFQAMNQLSTLTDGSLPVFGRKSSQKREDVIENVKSGAYAIRNILKHSASTARVTDDDSFDFDEHTGVYTWNFNSEEFELTDDSDIIEIHFPTEGSNSNDAEFRMTAYEEQATPNGDEAYSPTLIKASLLVDNTKQIELNAEVEYGNDDQPVKGDVYYFVNPFAWEVSFDDTKSKSSSFSETLSKSGKTLIGFGATVTYNTSEKTEENISAASAHFQLVDLKFTISAKASDASSENPYDAINISIKVKGKAGGKIILEGDENTGEVVALVKYNDGTTEPLEDLLQDVNFEVEDMLH